MTLDQALTHIAKVFDKEPMKLIEFEDAMCSKFIDDTIRKGRPFRVEVKNFDPDVRRVRIVVEDPIKYTTAFCSTEHLAVYEAAVYYVHNDLNAFLKFYGYPRDEAEEIIAKGFID